MTQLFIDNMDNAELWTGLASDDVTLSLEFTIGDDISHFPFGTSGTSCFVSGGFGALFHTLRRSLAEVNLTDYDYLQLTVNADLMADGSLIHPFFMEIRLASASMAISDPGNTWIRYLPISRQNQWQSIRLSLDDLPESIRSAVNLFQIRCVNADVPFGCYISQILGVKEEMVGDVDRAIKASLHNQLSVDDSFVSCVINVAGSTPSVSLPYILATHYRQKFSGQRTTEINTRGDFTPQGYRLKSKAWAYDFYYSIEAMADDRDDQAKIITFVLSVLPPMGELIINGNPVPYEMIDPEHLDNSTAYQEERPLIYYRILVRKESDATWIVKPTESVTLSVDAKVT